MIGDGYVDDMEVALGKDANIHKLLWSQMVLQPIYMDGGVNSYSTS